VPVGVVGKLSSFKRKTAADFVLLLFFVFGA
jgi:hypothetical protein